MAVHWALPFLESLLPDSLRPRLEKEAYVDPSLDWEQSPCDRMRMINGVSGEIMKDVTIKGKIVRVSRRRLRTFLAEGINVEVRPSTFYPDVICAYLRAYSTIASLST